ncbi:MAG: Cys-tRNA(Pro)/Cys-tRNA(Cys) deacylase YbaK [Desulfovibrio sp.]|uniref:Cys-tRNA(Pro) deacylase n=1 Tax=Christensenella intestinihominis TaxID=1851429 RepID=UPI000836AD71|nr:Cys-tRNA(Pro) deacylase [Christensenella intestinihominis]
MGNVKTNAMRMLDRAGIAYKTHSYEAADGAVDGVTAAKKLGVAPEKVFKTLVTQGADRQYFVFVIPVERELDLKKAARAVGEKNVEMIHVKDLNKVTGYIRGGCSPIGMKKAYGTVIDRSCEAFSEILVSAGKIGQQIELAPKDLADAAKAQIADLVRE